MNVNFVRFNFTLNALQRKSHIVKLGKWVGDAGLGQVEGYA